MTPQIASWLSDHAPWAIPVVIALVCLPYILWLVTDGLGLMRFGPRFWRVMRKLRLREYKRNMP